MRINIMSRPKYDKNQTVFFLGGLGTIKNYKPESNTWNYAIEMEMGPEPYFGRLGNETTVLLDEADITGALN
ncbi:MAG TPA: hypothetical protein DDW76_06820 [Cyanobacteria bacterium UBA11369]|nr:hypothetical protein [Cyanobacteria bacterium UBA11371]HBE35228.1 hypothetical protein [Cyanobacteria bacterium UBA11368]HBE48512.1 hypothetical protein [Cyanobacteria bacterium UBA11369]